MDMAGERLISAPQNTVWSALNDPEILKACIPGCESLEATSENEMIGRRGRQARADLGEVLRPRKAVGYRSTERLHPVWRGQGRPRRVRQGRGQGAANAAARRDAPDIHRAGAGRRQDRPAGCAADRRHREVDGGSVLHEIRGPSPSVGAAERHRIGSARTSCAGEAQHHAVASGRGSGCHGRGVAFFLMQ